MIHVPEDSVKWNSVPEDIIYSNKVLLKKSSPSKIADFPISFSDLN